MLCFLNDSKYINADTYEIFDHLMKLGGKQLYIDVSMSPETILTESYLLFFTDSFNFEAESFLRIRCYRILSVLLKELDQEVSEVLYERHVDPPLILLY